MCCFAAIPLTKSISAVVPELHCKHLSITDGKSSCGVYKSRHQEAKWCLPLPEAIAKGIFPKECPYVKDIPNYRGPVILTDDAYKSVRSHVRLRVLQDGQPSWADSSTWQDFVGGDQ